MSEALIVRRGGSGKLYAVIAVTYPVGSTCTCTNGTKTLKAKDTSGRALFHVPTAGTWTVSCTDGAKEKSMNVDITAEGQGETVALSYDLILYSRGVFGTDFSAKSGAYASQKQQAPSVTKSTEYVRIGQADEKSGTYITDNMIDVTNFKTLVLTYKQTYTGYSSSLDDWCVFGLAKSNPGNWGTNWTARKAITVSAAEKTESLDISELTGSFYIGIGLYHGRYVDVYDFVLS